MHETGIDSWRQGDSSSDPSAHETKRGSGLSRAFKAEQAKTTEEEAMLPKLQAQLRQLESEAASQARLDPTPALQERQTAPPKAASMRSAVADSEALRSSSRHPHPPPPPPPPRQ